MKYIPLVLLAVTLAGCTANGGLNLPSSTSSNPPPNLSAIQKGDRKLTCDQLSDQMAEMDKIINASPSLMDNIFSGASGAATTAATGAIAGASPYASGAVNNVTANQTASRSQQQSTEKQMAQDRKDRLMKFYDKKKCDG